MLELWREHISAPLGAVIGGGFGAIGAWLLIEAFGSPCGCVSNEFGTLCMDTCWGGVQQSALSSGAAGFFFAVVGALISRSGER